MSKILGLFTVYNQPLILVTVTILMCTSLVAQGLDGGNEIDTKIDSLERIEKILLDKLQEIRTELSRLRLRKANQTHLSNQDKVIVVSLVKDGYLLDKPLIGKVLAKVAKGTEAQVISYAKDDFFKVKIGSDIGFISYIFLPQGQTLDKLKESGDRGQRKQALIKKYGAAVAARIYNGEIWIGMTEKMAIDSWGSPRDKNRTVHTNQVHEQWVYPSAYLYFKNGILTSWQD